MGDRHVLLLTATVAPSGESPELKIRDPERREAQYLDALGHWCRMLPPEWEVVVAENSGWPPARFTEVGDRSDRKVHVLECEDRGSELGKSVGEASLLDDFARSELARDCDWIFKCTGRLYVKNVQACLPPLAGREGVCAAIVPSLAHMDSRFFGASREVFHRHFTDMGREMDESEGIVFERIAALRMLRSLAEGSEFVPFETLPYVVGRSGTLDTRYDSFSLPVKRALRQGVRRMMMKREILI